jgi:hypothetical protein
MSLQEQLDEVKKGFEASAPAEALTVMHRATEDLRNSGILDRVLKVGDPAPGFTLPDIQGQMVSSSELLSKGPLVVSIYRGVW